MARAYDITLPDMLDSPVFWSSSEIWTFLMDMAKEWKFWFVTKKQELRIQNVSREQHYNDDTLNGENIIGKKSIKDVFGEMFTAVEQGNGSPNDKYIANKLCDKNRRFTNLLCFIRNFGQHVHENLNPMDQQSTSQRRIELSTKNILVTFFDTYFEEGYISKKCFVQYIIKKVPRLLVYTWNIDRSFNLGRTTDSIQDEFFSRLQNLIKEYAEGQRICKIRYNKLKRTIELDVIQLDGHMFDRLYGTVITAETVSGQPGTYSIKVLRDHYGDATEFQVKMEKPISILFGAHKLKSNTPTSATTLFVKSANMYDVIKQLNGFRSIEITDRLLNYYARKGLLVTNGIVSSIKDSLPNDYTNYLRNMGADDWKKLFLNQAIQQPPHP